MIDVVILEKKRDPFQVLLVAWLAVAGIPFVLGIPTSAVTRALGTPYINLWGGLLVASCIVTLIGIYWPKDVISALFIEKTGLMALAGACLVWIAPVIYFAQWNGAFSVALILGICSACGVKIYRISKTLNRIREAFNSEEKSE